jgi:hypothetical protein
MHREQVIAFARDTLVKLQKNAEESLHLRPTWVKVIVYDAPVRLEMGTDATRPTDLVGNVLLVHGCGPGSPIAEVAEQGECGGNTSLCFTIGKAKETALVTEE